MIETKKMRLYLYISALSRSASTTKRTLLSQFNVLSHKVNQKCHNYKVMYQILLQILHPNYIASITSIATILSMLSINTIIPYTPLTSAPQSYPNHIPPTHTHDMSKIQRYEFYLPMPFSSY